MTEGELQRKLPPLVAELILWAYEQGYELTFGEAWRTPEQALWNSQHGIGIEHSLHIERLAIDFNLFKDGEWLTDPSDYEPLATYWKSLDPLCAAGADFGDADHFSLMFGGRK